MEKEKSIAERLIPAVLPEGETAYDEDGRILNLDQESDGGPPEWVCARPKSGDEVGIGVPILEPAGEIETAIQLKEDKSYKARRFLELVGNGVAPFDAARAQHTNLREIRKDPQMRQDLKALKDLIQNSRFPGDLRKEMVRAGLNRVFLDNITGKLKQQKLALDAARQMAKDPEIGLNIPTPSPSVTIDLGALGSMVDKMKPIAGLEDILVTVETEDEDAS